MDHMPNDNQSKSTMLAFVNAHSGAIIDCASANLETLGRGCVAITLKGADDVNSKPDHEIAYLNQMAARQANNAGSLDQGDLTLRMIDSYDTDTEAIAHVTQGRESGVFLLSYTVVIKDTGLSENVSVSAASHATATARKRGF